ncbi:MAG: ABC transporter substrate-binding protein [Pseudomonadota bacterium]
MLKMLKIIALSLLFIAHSIISHSAPSHSIKANEPIIIGMDADMSAGAAVGGKAIKRGAEIALQEINQNGGVLGRPLELMVKDHRGNPARGKKNIDGFAEQPNVAAILGGVHTPVALAVLPKIHKHKLIYLDPWAAGTAIVENGYNPNFVFRVSVRDSDAGLVLIERAKARGIKKVALVLERTGWGRSNEISLTHAAETNNIEIVATSWINWRQKDFTSEFNELMKTQPDALILVTNAPEGAVVVKTNIVSGANLPVISHWGIAGGAFVNTLTEQLLQQSDVEVLQTFHFLKMSDTPKASYVFNAYREKFDPEATKTSIVAQVGIAQAYDLVHLLAKAISAAGSISSEAVRSELEKIENYAGAVKFYDKPFSSSRHDALLHDDYFMTTFNENSELIPVEN